MVKAVGDKKLLLALLVLVGIGLVALTTASAGYAEKLGRNQTYFVTRQLMVMLPALVIFLFFANLRHEKLRRIAGPLVFISLAFLFVPFLPGIGETRNGASRWIDLKFFTFQPSELWKPALVLYLAHILELKKERIKESTGVLIPPFLVAAFGCMIIYLQNNLSTAVVAIIAALSVFWVLRAPWTFFAGLGAAIVPLAMLSVLTSEFRLRRIIAFLVPGYEPHGFGYQLQGAIKAIAAGGLVGKGVGLGTLKDSTIPEVHADFILAAWAEETGLLGVLIAFGAFAYIAWRGFRIAMTQEDSFKSGLAFGLTCLLCVEVLVNFAVVAGIIPVTGMALPFFSAGGSSLLCSAFIMGMLYSLSKHTDEVPGYDTRFSQGRGFAHG